MLYLSRPGHSCGGRETREAFGASLAARALLGRAGAVTTVPTRPARVGGATPVFKALSESDALVYSHGITKVVLMLSK